MVKAKMKIMRFWICLSLLTTIAYCAHEHKFHPDINYIRSEARRVAYGSFETTIFDVKDFHNLLTKMRTDYDKMVHDSGLKKH
jgi:hypothetical protein